MSEISPFKTEKEALESAVKVMISLHAIIQELHKRLEKFEWIDAKDRLPKVDAKVIVWNEENPDIEFMRMGYYDPGEFTKTGWRCQEYMDLHVTHWMPLPIPPQEFPCNQ